VPIAEGFGGAASLSPDDALGEGGGFDDEVAVGATQPTGASRR